MVGSMQVDEYTTAVKTWNLNTESDTRLDNPKYIYFGRNGSSLADKSYAVIFRRQTQLISDFAYCDTMLLFAWSVCLSVCYVRTLCSNGRRYRHNFLHTTAPCLCLIVLNLLTVPHQILPQSDPSLLTWASKTFDGRIAAEWLEIAQWSQWRADL